MQNKIPNPILYLYEHQQISEDILRWKNDEELIPWEPDCPNDIFLNSEISTNPNIHFNPESEILTKVKSDKTMPELPEYLQVGIGNYKTIRDGEIYLCVLINPVTRRIESYSIAVYKSPELVEKALKNLFLTHQTTSSPIRLKSSQNTIYRTKAYTSMLAKYPVTSEMTEKGTRGGVMPVSTFYSQLMRKRGSIPFTSWQDAVNWLCSYIYHYNIKHQQQGWLK